MGDLIWLSDAHLARINLYLPLSHEVLRVDDRRAISGIIFVMRHGCRRRDTPKDYWPYKTTVDRLVRTVILERTPPTNPIADQKDNP